MNNYSYYLQSQNARSEILTPQKKSYRKKNTKKSTKKSNRQSSRSQKKSKKYDSTVKEEYLEVKVIKAVKTDFGIQYLVQDDNGKLTYLIKDQIINDDKLFKLVVEFYNSMKQKIFKQ